MACAGWSTSGRYKWGEEIAPGITAIDASGHCQATQPPRVPRIIPECDPIERAGGSMIWPPKDEQGRPGSERTGGIAYDLAGPVWWVRGEA